MSRVCEMIDGTATMAAWYCHNGSTPPGMVLPWWQSIRNILRIFYSGISLSEPGKEKAAAFNHLRRLHRIPEKYFLKEKITSPELEGEK